MKSPRYTMLSFAVLFTISVISRSQNPIAIFPYSDFGLTERQAAAHLLNRFTFGARPGEIDQLLEMGLETWFERQLDSNWSCPKLDERLSKLQSMQMSTEQILKVYPPNGKVKSMAYREGVIDRNDQNIQPAEVRQKLKEFSKEKGFRPQRELLDELIAQKFLRLVYSENQLAEVLTDFWFNHFNVSITDNQAKPWVLSYEHEAIRPYVLGRFRDMLGATAKHPAMLYYLDNNQSNASTDATPKALRKQRSKKTSTLNLSSTEKIISDSQIMMSDSSVNPKTLKRGINENYARELMELHTLGVEGGYTQRDVVEVARAFTGWKVNRKSKRKNGKPKNIIQDGNFQFLPWNHDVKEKIILGQKFPVGGRIEEGQRVLDMLAEHPSTAKHISQKLATYFVSEDPPATLVDRLAKVFLQKDGNIKALMREISVSPEFWGGEKKHKTKSPIRLAASALRSTGANINKSRQLAQWVAKMGQPLYACRPPTGYPDQGTFWINTGTILNRMNFGISLASNQIQGIRLNLVDLEPDAELSSNNKFLAVYASLLLPERDITKMCQRLEQQIISINDKERKNTKIKNTRNIKRRKAKIAAKKREKKQLIIQAVGIILGSPEFQIY